MFAKHGNKRVGKNCGSKKPVDMSSWTLQKTVMATTLLVCKLALPTFGFDQGRGFFENLS